MERQLETTEQRAQERAWLIRNRLHPEFPERVKAFNEKVKAVKAEKTKAGKVKAKEFAPGEIVRVNHPKCSGLYKVVKVKISFLILKHLDSQKTFNVQSTLIEKIEKEDSDLISDLDEIGL
jgi:hypothetical protein